MPTTRSRRAFDSLQQEVYLNLWRTYDRLKTREERLFGQYGLTSQQYNALRLLQASHPRPMHTLEIASRLISRAPDITRMLDKLDECGYLIRQRPADNRRVVAVRITRAGLRLLDAMRQPLADCHEEQLGHLTKFQLRQLCGLLRLARRPHEDPDSHWS